MKKILAVLLALSMICVLFASCGSKEEPESTKTAEEEESALVDDLFGGDETTTAAETEATEATEPATDENDETVATEATEAESESETEAEEDDPANWDTAKIVAFYNEARHANKDKPAPKGHQTMKLAGDITGDGAIGVVLKVLNPAAAKALEKNSKDTDWIPAIDHADVLVSDVQQASAKKDAKGNVVITILFKNQVDGANGDSNNGGPVARGVGTLGSIDTALNELGAEITEGRDTVTLTYTNAYVKDLTVNPDTMAIQSGTFHYLVNVKIVNAKAKLGISVTLENLKAAIDYTVVVG